MDISERRTAQPYRGGNIRQPAFHQHHIRGINGNIRSGSYRNTYIGTGERGGIVYAVADHGNLPILFQSADNSFFSVGKHTSYNAVDLRLFSDGFGGFSVITREHDHTDAHILQFLYRLRTFGLYNVGNRYHSEYLFTMRKNKRRFALIRKVLSLL